MLQQVMASTLITNRARPIEAAEIFTTISILVMAVSFMDVAGNRTERAEVQQANVATPNALFIPAADIERARNGQNTNSEVETKAVALTDASP
jgi:hypothetical protein